jgi:hypothetical protein
LQSPNGLSCTTDRGLHIPVHPGVFRADKREAIPDPLAPIVERLGFNRIELGENRARLRTTVQAGGGATEFRSALLVIQT